mgnify:CR=1 FL=1
MIKVRMDLTRGAADRNTVVAWASVELDGKFAVHDVRVVQTKDARLLVCMPSRRRRLPCPGCNTTGKDEDYGVSMSDFYCPRCGAKQPPPEVRVAKIQEESGESRPRLHYDVCHPTTPEMRHEIERAVLDEYKRLTGPEDVA